MILQVSKRAAGVSAVLGCVLMAAAVAAGAADAPAGASLPAPSGLTAPASRPASPSLDVASRDASPSQGGDIEAGKAVANDRAKGNCVACHMIPGAPSPGTIGPALVAMKARYPDPVKLRAQIYDSTVANPESAMPPFGRNRLLTEKELNDVTAYIGSL